MLPEGTKGFSDKNFMVIVLVKLNDRAGWLKIWWVKPDEEKREFLGITKKTG